MDEPVQLSYWSHLDVPVAQPRVYFGYICMRGTRTCLRSVTCFHLTISQIHICLLSLVSSAKLAADEPSRQSWISLMCTRNKIGPRTDSWGTPLTTIFEKWVITIYRDELMPICQKLGYLCQQLSLYAEILVLTIHFIKRLSEVKINNIMFVAIENAL